MSTDRTNGLLQPGEQYSGFELKKVSPLPNLRAAAYQIEHLELGARLLHVYADDAENLMAIAFRTPPPDNTGVPHILEHSVLDGSRRYAAKKPFFEMVKMSMATFINAMTYADKTVYPIASNVRKDFFNLAEVYFDAAFHPILAETTLKQEGHRFDFKEPGDPNSDLIVKGIVYNEMKGVFSSPDSRVYRRTSELLFPDTPYGKSAGGDPDFIPDLTYDSFRRFHEEHYHPSNAYFFLYGDISTRDHLDFLSERLSAFQRRSVQSWIPRQPRWTAPRFALETYPVGAADDTAAKTYITMSWLVGDGTDVHDVLAFTLLDLILLGNQAAPLRKAIIESRLGEDLFYSGFSDGELETTFQVGLKGSEVDRRDAFVELVLNTLQQFADSDVEPERAESAFQQLAYRYQEIQSGYPLRLMDRAYNAWIYGADPLLYLRADEVMQELHAEWEKDPSLFQRMVRERLLENPHRLVATFAPNQELLARKEAEFAEEMAAKKASMDAAELDRIVKESAELERLQSTPNSPEELAALPQLKVSDVPLEPRPIPTTLETAAGQIPFLHNEVFSHGVNYLQLDIDLEGLPEDLYEYLPIYGDCVRKMGAAGMDYVRMAERVAAHTGGVSFGTVCTTHAVESDHCLRRARMGTKALDSEMEKALGVLGDYLLALDPSDAPRLGDVLVQARAGCRSSLASRGLNLALLHAARGLNPESALSEAMNGLPQVRLVERLADDFDQKGPSALEPLIEKLTAIREFMRDARRLTVSFTGSDSGYQATNRALGEWADQMRKNGVKRAPVALSTSRPTTREGLAGPMEVAFCAQVIPAPHFSHPDEPLLTVGGHLLSLDYMLEQVRVKGGAYGGGCGHEGSLRSWRFFSYRDPWINRTLDVFAQLKDFVATTDWSQADIDRSIIGTAKNAERPIRPGDATGTALSWHVMGFSPELRQERHTALLTATPPEVKRAVLQVLEENSNQGSVCVVSSRLKLEQANRERPEAPFAIEEIMK